MGELENVLVRHWGEMAGRWGVNRSVARIHGLLFLSPKALEAAEVGRRLGIARSNVSTGLRELQAWGLVRAVRPLGEKRDRFEAIHDVRKMLASVLEHRRLREIEPTIVMLRECLDQVGTTAHPEPYSVRQIVALLEGLERLSRLLGDLAELPAGQGGR